MPTIDAHLSEKLENHVRFWAKTNRRPLFGFCADSSFGPAGFGLLGDQIVTPDLVDSALYEAYRHDYTVASVLHDHAYDFFPTPVPDCGIPWMETIAGCPIRFSEGTRMAWAEQFADSAREFVAMSRLPVTVDDPWLQSLTWLLEKRQDDLPRAPIPLVLARGTTDILVAALSAETTILGLVSQPGVFGGIIQGLADMIAFVIGKELEAIRRFHGGHIVQRGLWAPGTLCMTQEDAAGLLNPDLFRDLVLPAQESIWDRFEYSIFHTHTTALRVMIDGLVASDKIKCVDCTVEAGGPDITTILPMLDRLQDSGKAVLVASAALTPQQTRLLVDQLRPEGLAFLISTATPEAYEGVI